MSFIRFHQQDAIHFVTNRIEHQMFLLLPTKQVNELILYWLARARVEYGDGIDIFGFIFLSNHFHILLRDTSGNLASFMNYFQGNLGAAVNARMLDCLARTGAFDAFGLRRSQLVAIIEPTIARAQEKVRDREQGQASLFDLMDSAEAAAFADSAEYRKKRQKSQDSV